MSMYTGGRARQAAIVKFINCRYEQNINGNWNQNLIFSDIVQKGGKLNDNAAMNDLAWN